jgi:uncharacterized protein
VRIKRVSISKNCLIIFARYPESGKVKTRLIPALGAAGAALLYRRMAERMIEQARALQNIGALEIEVWFTGGTIPQMQEWLGEDLAYKVQPEGNLGDRMSLAFASAFCNGCDAAILIGTDCPELSADLLQQSFSTLQQHPLVLGPATDGGYYLIGLRHPIPELFMGIIWSTDGVLKQTLEIAKSLNLMPYQLIYLNDIDRPQDLDCDSVQRLLHIGSDINFRN